MNNYFLLFFIFISLQYIIGIYAENANYIIAIRREKSDKNYIHETKNVQEKIDQLVNDRMNDIYEIIEEKKDTFFSDNNENNKNLNELNNSIQLKKRSNKKSKFYFINN